MPAPKLLFDENIGAIVAASLRQEGYDVVSILEETPGAQDREVLERARAERRILITLDRDFGRLIFLRSQEHVGVIFLRLRRETPGMILTVLRGVFDAYGEKLHGHFITASEGRVRIR